MIKKMLNEYLVSTESRKVGEKTYYPHALAKKEKMLTNLRGYNRYKLLYRTAVRG